MIDFSKIFTCKFAIQINYNDTTKKTYQNKYKEANCFKHINEP